MQTYVTTRQQWSPRTLEKSRAVASQRSIEIERVHRVSSSTVRPEIPSPTALKASVYKSKLETISMFSRSKAVAKWTGVSRSIVVVKEGRHFKARVVPNLILLLSVLGRIRTEVWWGLLLVHIVLIERASVVTRLWGWIIVNSVGGTKNNQPKENWSSRYPCTVVDFIWSGDFQHR